MFTGLVRLLATVAEITPQPPGVRVVIDAPQLAAGAAMGDSIAINGCCLTVVQNDGRRLGFDAGPETLARTNLGALKAQKQVNLEPALRVGEALGGHFVSGHVDGHGTLIARQDDQDWSTFRFRVDASLARQMASKGSVAVDGVSLTLVDVERDEFSVALIPHTLTVTTLGALRVGDLVNIETDLLAKYVQRLASPTESP